MLPIQETSPIPHQLIGDNLQTKNALLLRHELIDFCKKNNLYTPRYIEKLENCGTPITHAIKERCGLVVCPLCYVHKVNIERQNTLKRQKRLVHLNLKTKMVTVTFADVTEQEFLPQYNYLSSQYSRLINSQLKKYVKGTAKAIETSFPDTGLYHVHLHILLVYADSFNQEKLEPLIQKFFPHKQRMQLGKEQNLNLAQFYDYVTKIPKCDVEQWLTFRLFAKKKVTYTGILAKAWASPPRYKDRRQ